MASVSWWITRRGGTPVGPATTELVLEGIARGAVPLDALVCTVGGTSWNEIQTEPAFRAAIAERRATRAGDADRTIMDFDPLPPSDRPPPLSEPPRLVRFDDTSERTVAQPAPFAERASAPSVAPVPFGDSEDKTIVEPALSDRPTLRK